MRGEGVEGTLRVVEMGTMENMTQNHNCTCHGNSVN